MGITVWRYLPLVLRRCGLIVIAGRNKRRNIHMKRRNKKRRQTTKEYEWNWIYPLCRNGYMMKGKERKR